MENCIFCKIINGEIPSNKVYEDKTCMAFYDIEPQMPVHFLVIPKKHIKSMAEITPENSEIIAHIFEVISKLAKDLMLDEGFRVISNCGKHAGQTVDHLHFHVLAGKKMSPKII